MAVRIEPHAEPLPGYKLIERLGGGGFGEVWKAEAPGGLLKAIYQGPDESPVPFFILAQWTATQVLAVANPVTIAIIQLIAGP